MFLLIGRTLSRPHVRWSRSETGRCSAQHKPYEIDLYTYTNRFKGKWADIDWKANWTLDAKQIIYQVTVVLHQAFNMWVITLNLGI